MDCHHLGYIKKLKKKKKLVSYLPLTIILNLYLYSFGEVHFQWFFDFFWNFMWLQILHIFQLENIVFSHFANLKIYTNKLDNNN
jgi:hypothetical protein